MPGGRPGARRPSAFAWAFALVSLAALPAPAAERPPALQIRSWRPSACVHAIAQTRDGYLWLGTRTGLERFDGESFTHFDVASTPDLRGDKILALAVDERGELYLGFEAGGVQVRRQGRFLPVAGLDDVEVRTLALDTRGRMWAGTEAGLARLDGDRFTRSGVPPALAAEPIAAVHVRAKGLVVVGSTVVAELGDDGAARIHPLGPGRTGHVLGLGMVQALVAPDEAAIAPRLAKGRDRSLRMATRSLRTRSGALWLGGWDGIVVHRRGHIDRLGIPEGLPDEHIEVLFEDRDGNVWVGTRAGGLSRVRPATVTTWSRADGLASATIYALAAAGDDIWLATATGFSRRGPGGVRNWRTEDGVPDNNVRWLGVIPPRARHGVPGDVVLATFEGWILRVRGDAIVGQPRIGGPPLRRISGLLITRDGTVWAALANGELLRSRDGVHFEAIPPAPGHAMCSDTRPCPQRIVVMAERRTGALALGTLAAGLLLRDERGWRAIGKAAGLPHDGIMALHEDANGTLWIGTRGGLAGLTDGRVSSFAHQPGLGAEVLALAQDHAGALWICGERGVQRLEPRRLLARAAGGREPLGTISFGADDGMPSEECFRSFMPNALVAADGRTMFATTRGLAVFPAPADLPRGAPLQAFIERVTLNGTVIDRNALDEGAIAAPRDRGTVEITYTAPEFVSAERLRFRYRLDGFDEDWVEAGRRRTAYYTNLPAGSFRFVVEAFREDAPTQAGRTTLAFMLRPRFFATWWFRALAGAVLLGLAATPLWLRARWHRARTAAVARERARIAHDLHDDLAQVFSALGFHVDSLRARLARSGRSDARLGQLRDMIAHGRVAARQVIFDLKRHENEGRPLGDALVDLARVYPGAVAVAVAGSPRPLPAATANDLLLVAQEATSNAIQHGRAQRVDVTLTFAPAHVTLEVRDNGLGVGAASVTGDGVPGMRARAERVGGRLSIEAAPGGGTIVRVVLGGATQSAAPLTPREEDHA